MLEAFNITRRPFRCCVRKAISALPFTSFENHPTMFWRKATCAALPAEFCSAMLDQSLAMAPSCRLSLLQACCGLHTREATHVPFYFCAAKPTATLRGYQRDSPLNSHIKAFRLTHLCKGYIKLLGAMRYALSNLDLPTRQRLRRFVNH